MTTRTIRNLDREPGQRPAVEVAGFVIDSDVPSLADVFDNEVPPEWRMDLFTLIAKTPHLTWLLLTKRIGNVASMATGDGLMFEMLATRVWLGITVVNQDEADRDIPKLLATPAAKRFVSYEPALGPVRFGSWLQRSPSAAFVDGRVTADMPDWTRIGSTAIDWIIVGGESDQPGMRARPFDIAWARDTVRQCKTAGVPVFFKQGGSHAILDGKRIELRNRSGTDLSEFPVDIQVREFPHA